VGSEDRVRDATGRCHAAHFHCHIPRWSAIIDARQNVAVDINHRDTLEQLVNVL
jgi:hypothetical protein